MDMVFLSKYYKFFINGTGITLFLSLFGVIFGVIIGVFLALMKMSKKSFFSMIASAYIEIIRGTPLLVQLFIIYIGLPKVTGIPFTDLSIGIIAVSLNSAAYVAEIIRAGIQSIDKGQMEAARSLGMTHSMGMRLIIIPQAFKNILPALGNEFIVLVKESAIVSVIGIHDLMYNADTVRGISFKPFTPLFIAAIIYFIITFSLSKLVGILERRLRAGDSNI
ncbi:amino acid ABC transporter membrane protein, PAAT family (TC 3.A.1.3.-) [Paramaledivibacter caminithermalis DSM 15212]|uniref:Amino acid ABC transporter membrane protein, PAAT family (TC 3.A.1.3.-) n=2 Tax=Paramaledivibacter TaxID=1884934 RepID=A0A1M6MN73_PARC5|nr:amino acid ABC transporter membrane protein, PAAT family (TC 3.A.1.3.-) [Paramaledivibacter caminithermalis DSM 15212]